MNRIIKLFITILIVISIITHVTVVDAKKKKMPKKTIDEKKDVMKDMEKKAGQAGKECFEDTSKNEAQKKKCSLDKTKEETGKLKGENITDSPHEKIMILKNELKHGWNRTLAESEKVIASSRLYNSDLVKQSLVKIVPEYSPTTQKKDNFDIFEKKNQKI